MTGSGDEPYSASRATETIREIANRDEFGVYLTVHARERMRERELILDDVLHVLKRGFVYDVGEPSAREGDFKYGMQCRTPNSGRRTVRVVVIPSAEEKEATILSVMWADEPLQRG